MLIVAEVSSNHLGSLKRAGQLVEAAKESGADAVKFQTWTPGTMCLDRTYVVETGPWKGRNLFDLYEEAFTPWEWHAPLFEHARRIGLEPFSAPFDANAADFLEKLGVDRYKIASFEANDLRLVRYVASKGKKMHISTGTCSEEEIKKAFKASERRAMMVQCTSSYPAEVADYGAMLCLPSREFGISDHSLGVGIAAGAVALGAKYVEKHLTLKRSDGGLDSGFSSEPHEFKAMADACREAYRSACVSERVPGEETGLRRSWWAVRDIQPGEILTDDAIVTARPATGISASETIRGRKAQRFIQKRSSITREALA